MKRGRRHPGLVRFAAALRLANTRRPPGAPRWTRLRCAKMLGYQGRSYLDRVVAGDAPLPDWWWAPLCNSLLLTFDELVFGRQKGGPLCDGTRLGPRRGTASPGGEE